jgi:hypothetical protein
MSFKKTPEKKEPVEKLQEEHLTGPADEPIQDIMNAMKVGQIVISPVIPHMEKIIFRNQRDPGHPLEFHHSSKTHPFKKYSLVDGQEYTLPLEVIRSLEGCRENIEKYRRDSEGLPQVYIAGYKTHFVCERAA